MIVGIIQKQQSTALVFTPLAVPCTQLQIGRFIMPVKNSKQPTEQPSTPPDFDIESVIADELLDSIDWSRVKAAMLRIAKQRFMTWLTSGNNTPVNISAFPELAALPSRDDEGAA